MYFLHSLRLLFLFPAFLSALVAGSVWAEPSSQSSSAAKPGQLSLVVLQYHHVSDQTPPVTSISPQQFAAHLQLIADNNMPVVDLISALDAIERGEPLPHNAVAITFDDAYLSIYDNAYPLLKARNWPFTIFVNTRAVDQKHGSVMSWAQLRELQNNRGTMANHTQDHPYLLERPQGVSLDAWLNEQVIGAEQRLQSELNTSHKLLAYPYGEFDDEIANWLAQQGYRAFGQQSGPIGRDSQPLALPRFPAAGIYASTKTLKTKLKTLPLDTRIHALKDKSAELAKIPALLNPVLTQPINEVPQWQFELYSDDIYRAQIQCYASGMGAINTQAELLGPVATSSNSKLRQYRITAEAESLFDGGRGRYNCTAPSRSRPGYYYWHSQVWINTKIKNR